jgi:capsular polysaccharide transport system permease protein
MNTRLKVHYNVIWAIFSRDLKDTIFGDGILSLLAPFLIQLIIQLGVYTLLKKQTILGMNKWLFVVSGLVPFLFFEQTIVNNIFVFNKLKDSLSIKSIKVFHSIIANCMIYFICCLFIYMISLFIIYFILNINFHINEIIYIVGVFLELLIMTIGISFMVSIFGAYSKSMYFIIYAITRTLYFLSGVLIPLEIFPESIRKYFLWNPLIHLIEFSRYAFVDTSIRDDINFTYPLFCACVCLFFGLLVYTSYNAVFLKKAFE